MVAHACILIEKNEGKWGVTGVFAMVEAWIEMSQVMGAKKVKIQGGNYLKGNEGNYTT